jgi:hypothetical protein
MARRSTGGAASPWTVLAWTTTLTRMDGASSGDAALARAAQHGAPWCGILDDGAGSDGRRWLGGVTLARIGWGWLSGVTMAWAAFDRF